MSHQHQQQKELKLLSPDVFSGVKMVKYVLAAGLRTGPRWGSLQRAPDIPSWAKEGTGGDGRGGYWRNG